MCNVEKMPKGKEKSVAVKCGKSMNPVVKVHLRFKISMLKSVVKKRCNGKKSHTGNEKL
jgi:hypothetical protein